MYSYQAEISEKMLEFVVQCNIRKLKNRVVMRKSRVHLATFYRNFLSRMGSFSAKIARQRRDGNGEMVRKFSEFASELLSTNFPSMNKSGPAF